MSWHTAAWWVLVAFAVAVWANRTNRRRRRYRNGALPAPAAQCVVSNSPEMEALLK